MLQIDNLSVKVERNLVLDRVTLSASERELIAIEGSNGSGKSSLAMTVLGSPAYKVVGGTIKWNGNDLVPLKIEQRSRAGVYVSWQNPIPIPGVTLFSMCRAAYESNNGKIKTMVTFKKKIENLSLQVGLTREHIEREVNVGFSGGEKKRLELLMILLLNPRLIILDEIDSGLDKLGRELIVRVIKRCQEAGATVIVISHYNELLMSLNPTRVLEMKHGRLQTKE